MKFEKIGEDENKSVYGSNVNIMEKLENFMKEMKENPNLGMFMCSVEQNFRNSLDEFRKADGFKEDDIIPLALFIGFITSRIFEETHEEFMKEMIKKHHDELHHWRCKLDDDSELVIATNDENIVDNTLHKRVEEMTGKKVISPFVKLSERESNKISEEIVKHI